MYPDLYDKAKNIIKQNTCMKFYHVSKALYLETDTSGIGIGSHLLQVREGMNCGQDEVLDNTPLHSSVFASKSLSRMEQWYSNTERPLAYCMV